MMATTTNLSKTEYLKRYLSDYSGDHAAKKKKHKFKVSKNSGNLRIIDNDLDLDYISKDLKRRKKLEKDDCILTGEEAPVVVSSTDERSIYIQERERFSDKTRWLSVSKDVAIKDEPEMTFDFIKKEDYIYVTPKEEILHQNVSSQHPDVSKSQIKKNSGKDHSPEKHWKKHNSNKECSPGQSRKRRHSNNNNSPIGQRYYSDCDNLHIKRRHGSDSDNLSIRERHDSDSDNSLIRERHDSDSDNSPIRERHNPDADNSAMRRKHVTDNSAIRRRHDSDISPIRRRHDSDNSPIRRRQDSDNSPMRRRHDSDISPMRRRHDSDNSPIRRRHDSDNSPMRRRHDSDNSPMRRRHDSDNSPMRRRHDSDNSPIRQRHGSDNSPIRQRHDSDNSPIRQRHGSDNLPIRQRRDSDNSPLRRRHDSDTNNLPVHQKVLKLKKVKEELDTSLSKVDSSLLGKNAPTVFRDKSGRKRDVAVEKAEELAKLKKEKVREEQYAIWNRGLKQSEAVGHAVEEALLEVEKPLARMRDDKELDEMLRNQERDDDPMMQYMQKKKKANSISKGIEEKPRYQGRQVSLNRFKIPPGYRWDGVDRSNGFEKELFKSHADLRASSDLAYKWSTEDM